MVVVFAGSGQGRQRQRRRGAKVGNPHEQGPQATAVEIVSAQHRQASGEHDEQQRAQDEHVKFKRRRVRHGEHEQQVDRQHGPAQGCDVRQPSQPTGNPQPPRRRCVRCSAVVPGRRRKAAPRARLRHAIQACGEFGLLLVRQRHGNVGTALAAHDALRLEFPAIRAGDVDDRGRQDDRRGSRGNRRWLRQRFGRGHGRRRRGGCG